MVEFGRRLLSLEYEPWAPYYLDYNGLKTILEKAEAASVHAADEAGVASGHLRRFSFNSHVDLEPASSFFLQRLNYEVEKIVLFFIQEQGRIAYSMVEYRREQELLSSTSQPAQFQQLREKYHQVGEHLLHLIHFVELNVTGVRKILKKHDKLMHWAASGFYLGGYRHESYMLKPLLEDDTIAALCVTLEASLAELCQQEQAAAANALDLSVKASDGSGPSTPHHKRIMTEPAENAFAAEEAGGWHRRALSYSRHHGVAASFRPPDIILMQLEAARNRLKQSSDFAKLLAATAIISPSPELESFEGEGVEEEERPSSFSNLLNLMSTFLYMTNYYIVAPTSGEYAERLGGSKALAGMIIGMTPIAALASTLLYSWWTSHSYKAALIFASCCSIIGNLFYAAGLPWRSLTMVMLGRLVNGFGSARSINRRYIADSFSRAERTAASAAFVTAGALGMAAGPAIASFLHFATKDSTSLFWQEENAPGWFMFVVWVVYLVCLLIFFQDPPKRKEPPASSTVEMTGERKPLLLGNGATEKKDIVAAEPPLWKNIPVMTTFLIYFVLKLVLECILSSTAILTDYYFNWPGSVSGIYLAALGLLMLPANMVVALLSRSYEDRELIMIMEVLMILGCLIVIRYGDHYSVVQYIAGSVTIFLSTNALEGPNMSLLSKTIPPAWSKGFFNVGLLATEAGTLGRAVGDVFLTFCGSNGIQYLLNSTFGSMSALSIVTLLISYHFFDFLVPRDKDY